MKIPNFLTVVQLLVLQIVIISVISPTFSSAAAATAESEPTSTSTPIIPPTTESSTEPTTPVDPPELLLGAEEEQEDTDVEGPSFPMLPAQQATSVQNSPATATNHDEDLPKIDTYFPSLRVVNSTIFGRAACRCGVSNLGTKIVNGEPAKIRELPWTVGLARPGKGFFGLAGIKKPFCGGTLINNRYVITASHCVEGRSANQLKILFNLQDDITSTFSPTTVLIQDVEEIKTHPGYSSSTIDNDIALIRLAKPIPLGDTNSFVVPACLPANNDNDYSGHNGTVSGWGTIFSFGPQSLGLQKVQVPIISNKVCNSETQYESKITENMMCAGYVNEGGKDSCQGDSGGPLVVQDGDRLKLAGIVSWGYACAQPKAPGVYTRVGRYPGWILDNTRDADWCGE